MSGTTLRRRGHEAETVDDDSRKVQGVWPVLRVKTKREGCLRLSCYWTVLLAALVTGVCAVVWEMFVLNTIDRDFRDMMFDTRINNAARAYNHHYFRYVLPALDDLSDFQWSLPASAERLSEHSIPVLMLGCANTTSPRCERLTSQVNAATGLAPKSCGRQGGLVWTGQPYRIWGSDDSIELQVAWQGSVLKAPTLEVMAGSTMPDASRIRAFVADVKARYGDPRWVTPAVWGLPSFVGYKLYNRTFWTDTGRDRKKYGVEEDISWFGLCHNTSWNGTYITGYVDLDFPAFEWDTIQTTEVTFAGKSYHVPYFKVETHTDDSSMTLSRLDNVTLHVDMVLAVPCDAWQIAKVDVGWRELGSGTNPDALANLVRFRFSKEVYIVIRDASQPDRMFLPTYGGQFYVILGLMCGCLVFAGSIISILLWGIVLWNVRVSQGQHIPLWVYPTNRGW